MVESQPQGSPEHDRSYRTIVIATISAILTLGGAGYVLLGLGLAEDPGTSAIAFAVLAAIALLVGIVWWKTALNAIGHRSATPVPARVRKSLGGILGLVAIVTLGEYALFAWTQSRIAEALAGIAVSLVAFTFIGKSETRDLATPTAEQVTRLQKIERLFLLVAIVCAFDAALQLRQTTDEFTTFRDVELALEFTMIPAVLVGAWFVRRRHRACPEGTDAN